MTGLEAQDGCGAGEACVHNSECPAWLQERQQLDRLTKGTPARVWLAARLRSMICNKNEKHVCCKGEAGPIGECSPSLCSPVLFSLTPCPSCVGPLGSLGRLQLDLRAGLQEPDSDLLRRRQLRGRDTGNGDLQL